MRGVGGGMRGRMRGGLAQSGRDRRAACWPGASLTSRLPRPLAAEHRPPEAKAHRVPRAGRPGPLDEFRLLIVVRKGASLQNAKSFCREDAVCPPTAQGHRPTEFPSDHREDGAWAPESATVALGGLWP